ncbi:MULTISPECIES: GNAT family N-acetyltransferase [unclassified Bacillus (in: firmicutes)]|uniref:GNAT family N-acetyltransferase n=1 Tax=unclassified Bacillus (in: firmicutes) TaxID=185979 RepID=UPI0020C89A3E|nr:MULTISPECIES: GNAT family protein [unclassified Bacillus (in: firmicutes)]
MMHFIIEDRILGDSVVGYVILGGVMNPNKSVELIRITIGPKGKGYGKEAFKLLKDWVFRDFDANRLWLDVKVGNSRAIHLYESQGFVIEGTLRECLLSRDGYESLHVMSILRREFDCGSK